MSLPAPVDIQIHPADRIDYVAERAVSTVGYEGALRSGIENVLRNAARHHRGEEPIKVRLDTGDGEAVVTIEDQGGGVAEHELGKIFEPFYRAAARPSGTATEGSGLGLSIAGRAVELNMGSLRATNTARGLAVEIRLPLAPGSASA